MPALVAGIVVIASEAKQSLPQAQAEEIASLRSE
jgi:hypothetical protein